MESLYKEGMQFKNIELRNNGCSIETRAPGPHGPISFCCGLEPDFKLFRFIFLYFLPFPSSSPLTLKDTMKNAVSKTHINPKFDRIDFSFKP